MDLLKLCKEMIGVNSVTVPNGTLEIVSFLSPIFQGLGCTVKTQELLIEGHANWNLLATLGPPDGEAPFLFNTHLDTVSPGPHPEETWTQCQGNPFQATRNGNFLYGLGVADTKLAMACFIVALDRIIQKNGANYKNWRHPLRILGSAGEERGLLGADYALKSHFVSAKYALDSEPSELKIVWAHKGIVITKIRIQPKSTSLKPDSLKNFFSLSFAGEAAHSSTPHLGKNAIDEACFFLDHLLRQSSKNPAFQPCWLEGGSATNIIPAKAVVFFEGQGTLEKFKEWVKGISYPANLSMNCISGPHESARLPYSGFKALVSLKKGITQIAKKLEDPKNFDFSPPFSTSATTLIRPKISSSSLPQLILFQDHRFIEPGEGNRFFNRIALLVDDLKQEFPELLLEAEMERINEPMFGNKESAFVQNFQEILQGQGLSGDLETKAGCTEGSVFSSHGIETIVFGPGRAENNIHKPNEKVLVKELHQAVDVYEKVIEKFCV